MTPPFFQFFFLHIGHTKSISSPKSSCIESIVHRVHEKNIDLCKTSIQCHNFLHIRHYKRLEDNECHHLEMH